jgi:hypothetical protein
MDEDLSGQTYMGLQTPMSIKKNTAQTISANSLKKKFPHKDNEEEAESERIYPSNISSILTE